MPKASPASVTAETIFGKAISLSQASERQAYLDNVCAGDTELRGEVERLVADHFRAGDFLNQPAVVVETAARPPLEGPGTVIGPYKLLEQIGEGGMGVVYMAQQTLPVKRKVALKVIKPGMDSRQVIARFEAERQALAMMEHPNIARILDAGTVGESSEVRGQKSEVGNDQPNRDPPTSDLRPLTSSSGRPYFVMELVRGIPITDFCDQKRLTVRQRLELFIQVCHAVQHAHQKGIIHRDLKPTNVLVTLADTVPVPKVIDFGIAKAIGNFSLATSTSHQHSLHTGFAQLIGTPLYMSPEQAEMNAMGVDTRSDVYSLGVLLYELLTGTTPFAKERLKSVGFDEMRRIIREEEPETVSTRLARTRSRHTPCAVAGHNGTRSVPATYAELDWIVAKSLEKDRTRRYESPSAFAADIQRYLADEPVAACPPSAAYRFRKFAKKHRAALATAVTIGASLLVGAAASTWQAIRATHAETLAKANEIRALNEEHKALAAATAERAAKQEEIAQRQRAEENERKAIEAAAEAKAVLGFLQGTVMLARPQGMPNALGKEVTLRQAVERAARDVGNVLKDQPGAVAGVRQALGVTYRDLGELKKAIEQHQLAYDYLLVRYGADDPHTLDCLGNLAQDHMQAHHHAEAIRLLEQGLALAKGRFGPQDDRVFQFMNDLGIAYRDVSRHNESIALLEDCLAHARAKPNIEEAQFTVISALAQAYVNASRFDQAVALFKEGHELGKRFADDDYRSVEATLMLAKAYFWSRETGKAAPLLEEVLKRQRAVLGSDHPQTIDTINLLADAYTFTQSGKSRPERLPLKAEAYRWLRANHGDLHGDTIDRAHFLLATYEQEKKFGPALAMLHEALPACIARLPAADRQLMTTITLLGDTYQANGDLVTAHTLYRGAYKLAILKAGYNHFSARSHVSALAGALKDAGKSDEAALVVRFLIPPIEAEVEANKSKLGLTNKQTIQSLVTLITTLSSAQEHAKMEPLCRLLIQTQSESRGADDSETLRAKAWLAEALLGQKKYTEAEAVFRDCLAGSQQREPDLWTTFKRRSRLGEALLGQARDAKEAGSADAESKFAAAEQELIAGYEGLKAREGRGGHWWLAQATKQLLNLYTAWNKPEEAAKWRKELEAQSTEQPQ